MNTGATATGIGTGSANTTAIINAQGAGSYAAQLCRDYTGGGKSDWFLPAKDELNELYTQKIAVGGFVNSGYWSSSEYDSGNAWSQSFLPGSQYYTNKSFSFNARVRPVRMFSDASPVVSSSGPYAYTRSGDVAKYERVDNAWDSIKGYVQVNDAALLNIFATANFTPATLARLPQGIPYVSIPSVDGSVAAYVNNSDGSMTVTATIQELPTGYQPAIALDGYQITDMKGNVYPGFEAYVKPGSIDWNSGTFSFANGHFTTYNVLTLIGKSFTGTAKEAQIIANGSSIVAQAGSYIVTGDAAQNSTTVVAKISGLAYELKAQDVQLSTANNVYKPLTPGQDYGFRFQYINRGNDSDNADISALVVGDFNVTIPTTNETVAPWQVLTYEINIDSDGAQAFERATVDVTVSLNANAVSYTAFSGAYIGGTFEGVSGNGAYGGEGLFTNSFVLEAEGYSLKVVSRNATITKPDGYTGTDGLMPGAKIKYDIAIENQSDAIATSINLTDVIPPNCHFYYDVTPNVVGAIAWEWQGATDNNKTSVDTTAIKYEITISANAIATASYTVTLD